MNNNNQNFKNIVKETIADVAVDGITRLICENEKGDFYAIIPDPNTGFDYESAKGFVLGITAADVEKSNCYYCRGIESHGIVAVKTVIDEYLRVIPAYDTPYNFCPNCGRKIKEATPLVNITCPAGG